VGRVSGTGVPNPGWGSGPRHATASARLFHSWASCCGDGTSADQHTPIVSETAHSKAGELHGMDYRPTVIVARRTRPNSLAKHTTETSLSDVSVRGLAGKGARSAAAILSTPAGVVFVAVP